FDDIRIFNAPDDVGIDTILMPQTQCEPFDSVYPVVSIKNFGLDSINVGDSIAVGIDMQYETETTVSVFDTCVVNEQVPPDSTYEFTLDKTLDLDTIGDYSLTAYTIMEKDSEFYQSSNDTTTKQVSIHGYPTADLGPDINTVEPDTLVLSTPGDPDYDYDWTGPGDASGNEFSNLSITDKDTISVIVTNILTGCQSFDSVVVTRLMPDIGVDSILHPVSDCEIGEETYVSARIRNYGTDTLFVDDSVIVGASIEGGDVRDTLLMEEQVNPGEAFIYELTKPLDMSALDFTYDIQVYTQLVPEHYETDNSNDTLSKEVVSYGYPDFSLDIDTTVAALSYEINAEPGYPLYEWEYGEDNSPDFLVTDSLYETTGDEWYTVTVTDESGCSASDSAHVKLLIHDLMASQKLAPVSDCELSERSQAEIEILNNGTDTVHSGDSIFVGFDLDTQTMQTDTIEVAYDLLPGSSMTHVFDSTADLSNLGDYKFDFYTQQPDEMRSENDTLTDVTTAYGYPDVDLGPDSVVTAASYTLDPGDYESYLWHDGSESSTFTVTEENQTDDHLYSVLVNDNYGCPGSDTVEIMLNIIDMSVTDLINPVSICNYGDSIEVQIELTNSGNTSIVSGITFPLKYNIKEGDNVEEEYELQEQLEVDSSIEYTFETNTVANDAGQHEISASVNYAEDVYPDNDKLEETFRVYELPDISFEEDTVWTEDFPYTLDPGSFSSYEWQDGSTDRTYDADEEGTYWVRVTNQFGCSAADTIVLIEGEEDIDDTGVESVEETDNIKIFPNPARDKIFVELDVDESLLRSMRLVDATGAVVYSGEDYRTDDVITIETNNYARGVYYLILQLGDNIYQKKVVLH
ncbi:MAG: T9SS type A sorting domain-containing protein, partial [Bacteroidales bacterium]